MKKLLLCLVGMASMLAAEAQEGSFFEPYRRTNLRLPSVPLIVNDPYFSIWSPYNNLYDGTTCHWTGQRKSISGLLRVDGVVYRFMGKEGDRLLNPVAPMADIGAWTAKVSYVKPATNWIQRDFNDSKWQTQRAAFGSPQEYPNIRTSWTGLNSDIYIRRHVTLTKEDLARDLWLIYSHDDKCEVYVNGILAVQTGETWLQNEELILPENVKESLHVGDNIIAYHVHNTTGGANADIGLFANVKENHKDIRNAVQTSCDVMATNTYYSFRCGGINLRLVFTAPMFLDDLNLLSTPINYVSYQVCSNDKRKHDVQIFFGTTPELAVIKNTQPTISCIQNVNNIDYVRTGSVEQNVLGKTGDLLCIDWGYLMIPNVNGNVTMADQNAVERQFVDKGTLAQRDAQRIKSNNESEMPMLGYLHNFGLTDCDSSYMMIGYDEIQDVQFLGTRYKAYWSKDGQQLTDAFENLRDNYKSYMQRARRWDKIIYDDALAAGNKKYAETLAASYRQTLAAHKLFMDKDGDLMYFSKENSSGGFINTVDVTYPAAPLFFTYNIQLEKGALEGIFKYCADSSRWGFHFPAHDLGFYPIADKQTYASCFPGGNGDFGKNMPVEEAGNMVILTAMTCLREGKADFAKKYWDLLTMWTNYLVANGQDPANQLCTDDFAGHLAHNVNLSVKAIMGIAGYALMAQMQGEDTTYRTYMDKARRMAATLERTANDGDHYRLAYDRSGTWSMKYNMVWDKLWGLNLFSKQMKQKEYNYYLTKAEPYGIPLDNRERYTKSDWEMWTACLADTQEGFTRMSDFVWEFADKTKNRVPFSDWYWVNSGDYQIFQGRSVLGGHWMKVLMDNFLKNKKLSTGIENPHQLSCISKKEIGRYDVDGRRLSAPTRGINVVLYKDKTVKKVIVK